MIYPLIPWAGVMAAGYIAGPIFALEHPRGRRLLCLTGLSLIGAFVASAPNVYGDPEPWSIRGALCSRCSRLCPVRNTRRPSCSC